MVASMLNRICEGNRATGEEDPLTRTLSLGSVDISENTEEHAQYRQIISCIRNYADECQDNPIIARFLSAAAELGQTMIDTFPEKEFRPSRFREVMRRMGIIQNDGELLFINGVPRLICEQDVTTFDVDSYIWSVIYGNSPFYSNKDRRSSKNINFRRIDDYINELMIISMDF
jgi:hypothetical protein